MKAAILTFCFVLGLGTSLWAVEPDEMLADPELEARAQALDQLLRCVVCRSENIASSQSDWASDARVLLREQIAAGVSDEDALAFFQARYGDYVLMDPPRRGANLVLWAAGPTLAVIGLLAAGGYIRSRRKKVGAERFEPLSQEEQTRLAALLNHKRP